MGTRSTIAIQNEDGSVTGIYCHWDGYISHNGNLLHQFYRDEDKVRELIKLGDINTLRSEIGEKHPFHIYNITEDQKDPRWENWTTAFKRDRGEDIRLRAAHNWQQFVIENGQEYNYLFVPGKGWTVNNHDLIEALYNKESI